MNIITGGGATVGEELASHPDVDKVSFTGSTVVGRRIMQLASSDDQEVHARAGRQVAEHRATRTRTSTPRSTARCGPRSSTRARCASRARGCSLPESIHDEFVEQLVARAKQIKIGDALDYDTDMGPLVSAGAARHGRELRAHRPGGGREARAAAASRPDDAPDGGLLLRADDLHRRRQLDDDRPGGDLRAGAVGDQVQVRRRGDPDRQRLDLRPGARRCGRRTTTAASRPRRSSARARSGSTTTT